MLKTLPDQYVQCCVTSPPYFGLRDYGVAGQIGLEPTPAEFVAEMVGVFREVWRVLRDDGTCWLNLGDSYTTGASTAPRKSDPKSVGDVAGGVRRVGTPDGLKPKDLMGIPWRVAFALQDDGWFLRRDIIWAKPNPMPESCTDRPTTAHEYVFLLTKKARYFYDAEAVREEGSDNPITLARNNRADKGLVGACGLYGTKQGQSGNGGHVRKVKVPGGWDRGEGAHGTIHRDGRTAAEYQEAETKAGRNLRSVWTIATAPFAEAHFATFPPKLAETCILAGTSERGACSSCGAPWARTVSVSYENPGNRTTNGPRSAERQHETAGFDVRLERRGKTTGWQPTCDCPAADPVPCVVLDPFGGAGTVALVADRLQREAILIELNPDYVEIARRRVTKDAGLLARVEVA